MGHALTEVLPLAVGIALTPLAVLAVLLILLSHGGLRTATTFLVGWTVTLTAVAGAIAVAGIGRHGFHGRGIHIAEVVIGALLVTVAVLEWRRRPPPGALEAPPAWMRHLDALRPARAFGLGALLAVNPKDLALTIAAGAKIAGLDAPQAGVVLAVFVAISTVGVAVPIVVRAVMGDRAAPLLARARDGIERNGRAIGAAVVGIIGLVALFQGIRGLT